MHRFRSPLLTLACLGLLISQLSGLHMHVDANGYAGVPEPTHVHRMAVGSHHGEHSAGDVDHDHPGDPDHQGDRDVSIVELGAGASKLLIFSAWLYFGLILVRRKAGRVPLLVIISPPKTRRERWRPPLRAPPLPPAR